MNHRFFAVSIFVAVVGVGAAATPAEAGFWRKVRNAGSALKHGAETVVDKTTSVATWPAKKLIAEPTGKLIAAAARPSIKAAGSQVNDSADHIAGKADAVATKHQALAKNNASKLISQAGGESSKTVAQAELISKDVMQEAKSIVWIAGGAFVVGCGLLGFGFRRR